MDQSAEAVRGWVERMGALPSLSRAFDGCAAFPAARPVALGVLRGGHADEGAWRLDPARPSVLVGTVDLVGSRLLFAGYGSGRSRRAMDAGLLGHYALVLLDEAHLSPAMAGLLDSIARLNPSLRVMRLSATAPGGCGEVLGLGPDDLEDEGLRRRLHAVKRTVFVEVATPAKRIDALVEAAAGHRTGAVAVFVERVADARQVASRLAQAKGADRVAVLTGTLRGQERAALASGAVWRRLSPGRGRTEGGLPAVHLVMTSAGEVGVDLDADHAVMDLSPLDSMVQRLGRVNRAGLGHSTVTVVHTAGDARRGARTGTPAARLAAAKRETLALLRGLPDLSPASLRAVDRETFARCASPGAEPARLDRAVVEAFAMTSADLPLPRVEIYLKGVSPAPEVPRTSLAWRRDVADLVLAGPEGRGRGALVLSALGLRARAGARAVRETAHRPRARAPIGAGPSPRGAREERGAVRRPGDPGRGPPAARARDRRPAARRGRSLARGPSGRGRAGAGPGRGRHRRPGPDPRPGVLRRGRRGGRRRSRLGRGRGRAPGAGPGRGRRAQERVGVRAPSPGAGPRDLGADVARGLDARP